METYMATGPNAEVQTNTNEYILCSDSISLLKPTGYVIH
jgi:hypothetical protein